MQWSDSRDPATALRENARRSCIPRSALRRQRQRLTCAQRHPSVAAPSSFAAAGRPSTANCFPAARRRAERRNRSRMPFSMSDPAYSRQNSNPTRTLRRRRADTARRRSNIRPTPVALATCESIFRQRRPSWFPYSQRFRLPPRPRAKTQCDPKSAQELTARRNSRPPQRKCCRRF